MRRAIDIGFAVVWLLITMPLLLLIVCLIRIESKGAVFYTPTMVGYKGRRFTLYRFRTMSTTIADIDYRQALT